ncbi:MAG: ABC transporter ATP-binding protein [Bacillota bacterium]
MTDAPGTGRTGRPLLEVHGLSAGYGAMRVLHEVGLTVDRGEMVSIIGPNGAGKSTVLKAVFGEVTVYGGRVLFDGEDVTGWSPRRLLRRGLAYVPQGRVVFPSLTVRENLTITLRSLGMAPAREALDAALEHFPDLAGFLDHPAGALSGGQQQMVAIARGLTLKPRLLMMDEPSLGLAPALVKQLFGTLERLRAAGMAILLVEQNARMALAHSDRGYVLEMGRNRLEGEGRRLLADERVQQLYLGGARPHGPGPAPRPEGEGGAR